MSSVCSLLLFGSDLAWSKFIIFHISHDEKNVFHAQMVGSNQQNELAKSEKSNKLAEQIGEIYSLGPPTLAQQD